MEINTGIRLEENPTYGTLRSERRQKDGDKTKATEAVNSDEYC
jgi:hypothetical protein